MPSASGTILALGACASAIHGAVGFLSSPASGGFLAAQSKRVHR